MTRTAEKALQENIQAAKAELEKLTARLDQLSNSQYPNWSHVGSAAHIKEELENLTVQEPVTA